jgi:signal transduction histidine kinase
VRLDSGLHNTVQINIADLVDDVGAIAAISATSRDLTIEIGTFDKALIIEGDRQIIASILTNLLQNACKFTPRGGRVSLNTFSQLDSILFEIADECGGLPEGMIDSIFEPFKQASKDRTGLGLGLQITRRGVAAIGGRMLVRNVGDKGCVFAVEVPHKAFQDVSPS